MNDTKYLKRLDLSKQKLLINVEFRRSNVEELDIRATTRVCDQDEEDVALDLMIVKNFVRSFTTKIGDICIGFKIAQRLKD